MKCINIKALSILALSLSLAATSFGYLIYDAPDGYFPHIGSTYSECEDIWGAPISFKTNTDVQHAKTIYHFRDDSDSDFVDVTIPSWDNKVWYISYYGNPITPDQVPWLLRMNAPEGAVWTELKGTPGLNQNWRLNLEGHYLLAHYYTNKTFSIDNVGETGQTPMPDTVQSESTPTPTPTPAPVVSAKPVLMDDVDWIAWYYHLRHARSPPKKGGPD
jgi:hypothetical protein